MVWHIRWLVQTSYSSCKPRTNQLLHVVTCNRYVPGSVSFSNYTRNTNIPSLFTCTPAVSFRVSIHLVLFWETIVQTVWKSKQIQFENKTATRSHCQESMELVMQIPSNNNLKYDTLQLLHCTHCMYIAQCRQVEGGHVWVGCRDECISIIVWSPSHHPQMTYSRRERICLGSNIVIQW